MSDSKLFEELESEVSVSFLNDNEATVEILNDTPRNWEVYIYGVCEFVFDDGTKVIDRQLGKHYRGDSVKWRSNKPLKCCTRVNVALIAKSHQHPGEGKYAIADEAPADQCIIQRGWKFGTQKNVEKGTESFENKFSLSPISE
ncbi:hypothetical protein [Methylophaga muralis]|uniref:Uncharacterized protein n=1 Tax=Methylophaga muralis TaxID=291169 RepID=A0A1E3GNB5_9GAMM|nr:hypothetical protein [Methylophaga muralis]ODN65445.1 hypothetical protein A9E74_02765 [Methylophaga muralis]